ncbi:MAG: glycosyltransferase family 4 protein [Dehalococcoidia bacterium]
MRILFYETIQKRPSSTAWTHIFELLNNLSRLGHSIAWVNGQNYSPVEEFDIGLDLEQRQSLWERTKAFVMTLPFRGEAMLLWNLLKEVRLFFVAFGTALRHKPDVIYRRHGIFNTECIPAKLFKVPLITEVNGIVIDEVRISEWAGRFSLRIIDRIERLNLRQADKIIVVTSKLKELLHNDYKIPEDKIVVIENGANTKLFQPMGTTKARQELNLSQTNNYICFVGHLWQVQGVEYLIKAMPRILEECPNTQLLIVGSGQTKEELVKVAQQVGVSSNVLFTGRVPYQRVPLYINASDICAAPFIKARNERSGVSPLKLCEYLACQKPVVASNLSGLEMLEQNNAGILVEPEAPGALAKAIIRLLQDPDCRKQMGENGRKYVVKNRSWESVARRVAEVCQQALENYTRQPEVRFGPDQ